MTTCRLTRLFSAVLRCVHVHQRLRQRFERPTPSARRPDGAVGHARRFRGGHADGASAGLARQRRAALYTPAHADRAERHLSSQSGTRTYEFQVSDRTDFSLGSSLTSSFLVAVSQTGVPEGSDGRTSFTAGQDCSRRRACIGGHGPFRDRHRLTGPRRQCSRPNSWATTVLASCTTR